MIIVFIYNRNNHKKDRRESRGKKWDFTAGVTQLASCYTADAIALSMLKAAGSRVTHGRVATLSILLTSKHALTHNELEEILSEQEVSVEKVTVYRILDWLVEHQLAHKVTGQDRVWRFNALVGERVEHAHFNCTVCGQITCLQTHQAATTLVELPQGFVLQHADLTLEGICSNCSH